MKAAHEQEILRLDVSVAEALGVKECDSVGQLANDIRGRCFRVNAVVHELVE